MAWTTPTTVAPGDAILASLWNSDVKGNTDYLKDEVDNIGLVHINTTTLTGSGGAAFDNVFTSTYTNYRIIITQDTHTSGSQPLRFYLRGSGSNTTNGFYQYGIVMPHSGGLSQYQLANQAFCAVSSIVSANQKYGSGAFDVLQPQLAEMTFLHGNTHDGGSANGVVYGVTHQGTISYDGFYLQAGAGNFSAVVRVFGYRNS